MIKWLSYDDTLIMLKGDKMNEFEFLSITKENPIHLNIDLASTDYLCHYTDANGMNGILSSNSFWVTRSDYLNDLSEIIQIKQVIECVHNTITANKEKYINEIDPNGMLLENYMSYIKFLGSKLDNSQATRDYDIYVLSLSENSDSLALFSYYSTSDGCCLGFDTDKLLSFKAPTYNFSDYKGIAVTGGKVIYSLEEQIKTLMNDILEVYNSVFDRIKKHKIHVVDQALYNKIFDELMHYTLAKVSIYSIFIKHQSFYHEEEYRIAFLLDKEHSHLVKHMTRGSGQIPYIEFEFSELPLKFIRRSPKNNADIKSISKDTKYRETDILDSQIPLR